jgi:hypothetical protein
LGASSNNFHALFSIAKIIEENYMPAVNIDTANTVQDFITNANKIYDLIVNGNGTGTALENISIFLNSTDLYLTALRLTLPPSFGFSAAAYVTSAVAMEASIADMALKYSAYSSNPSPENTKALLQSLSGLTTSFGGLVTAIGFGIENPYMVGLGLSLQTLGMGTKYVVQNYYLPTTPTLNLPATYYTLNGDLNPLLDSNGNLQTNAWGNIISDGQAAPGIDDIIFGSGESELINAGSGNDQVRVKWGQTRFSPDDGENRLLQSCKAFITYTGSHVKFSVKSASFKVSHNE